MAISITVKHAEAQNYVAKLRAQGTCTVSWISPITSVLLAAERIHNTSTTTNFDAETYSYAETIGLRTTLEGGTPLTSRTGLSGYSYSPLARLSTPETVELATDTVTECIHAQLDKSIPHLLSSISHVIGELHDNVASHSRGTGYSALQYYPAQSKILFAVADAGVGLLKNAAKAQPSIASHLAAVHWCFERGNTSAVSDDWDQLIPSDANSPFPKTVGTRQNRNNHAGEGLWQLLSLVRKAGGSCWVWTGNAEMLASPSIPNLAKYSISDLNWGGLALELMIPVERELAPSTIDLTEWAKKLGI